MKTKIYDLLVNRQPGISERYHKYHAGSRGIKKFLSWMYLGWLNFAYYVLNVKHIGRNRAMEIYEEKKLPIKCSESELSRKEIGTVEQFVDALSEYDVVSFDIFDTLIFRPFSEPTDLFFFVGENLGVMNFKQIRMKMEQEARKNCYRKKGHYEVTLREVWEQMEQETGIPAETGRNVELEMEKKFCYANPFMQAVYNKLCEQGKKIIIVSDMYLSKDVLEEILCYNGYDGYEKLYVSCEYGKNKAGGQLYEMVKQENPGRMIHVGDNLHSDVNMAKKQGLATCYYPNVNKDARKYRPYDMSPMMGGAYRGIINNHINNGQVIRSMEYEYGFICGGLFVAGYCSFIQQYCQKNKIDKVLFLSRDGDVLNQAYRQMFPEENTEYVYWSRRVATKLMAAEDRYDFFRRFLFHKVNQGITIEKILSAMDLQELLSELPENLSAQRKLTHENVEQLKDFLVKNWEKVLALYGDEQKAAKQYYEKVLQGCYRVVAVDIGWAGSGAIALNHLVQHVWNLPCEVVGLIAGTNTIHNSEPETSETFLQSGKLVPYLYSQSLNRDLMKKHNPNRNYNVYWELLLSSPTPQLKGFSLNPKGEVEFVFGDSEPNQAGIKEIQTGIFDFVTSYKEAFGEFSYMWNISGRDAYAPMLVAAGKGEKYLKQIEKRFSLEKNVS